MRQWLPLFRKPDWMPVIGIAAGLLVWVVDTLIDHYIFHAEDNLLANAWPENPSEQWMRILILVLFFALSWYARMLLKREISAKEALAQQQATLEKTIEDRTRELQANYRSLKREVEERQKAQAQLETLATTDPLTHLYNRRKFDELLSHELERCRRYAGEFALIMFDIDHFKRINDSFGHDAGDTVLRFLAEIVQSQLRKSDIIARWGGEEFVALISQADQDIALAVAEKLRRTVESGTFPKQLLVTISLGVALARSTDTAHSLLKRADEALYRAKQLGRNRCILESPENPSAQPLTQ